MSEVGSSIRRQRDRLHAIGPDKPLQNRVCGALMGISCLIWYPNRFSCTYCTYAAEHVPKYRVRGRYMSCHGTGTFGAGENRHVIGCVAAVTGATSLFA